jgi:hypothetical protein
MNISRLDPIPPNALPVSKAARARKNLPSAKININAKKSPAKCIGLEKMNTGTSNAAAKEDEITIIGAALNIQEAVSETTWPFENSLIKL